jgi:hypothetical protein
MLDNPDHHWRLAEWCRKHKLADQERVHLERMLAFEPDHAEARARLGFVRVDERWISLADLQSQHERAEQTQADFERWQPQLAALRDGLASPRRSLRLRSAREIEAIRDPGAIAALETLFIAPGHARADLALACIAAMDDSEATQSLARIALLAPQAAIRLAAADHLRQRPWDEFVPLVLASLSSPIDAQVQLVNGGGRLVTQRLTFVREVEEQHERLVVNKAFDRVNLWLSGS